MDVISMDEEKTVYNSEMQPARKSDLAKRSRYYQSLLDANLLEPGIPNYNLLNQSYIILITPFDLFGYGKFRYTFEAKCKEVPELKLEDGATRIFLNTRGRIMMKYLRNWWSFCIIWKIRQMIGQHNPRASGSSASMIVYVR